MYVGSTTDILKCTNQKNPDYDALMSALASIRNVNKYINEDKRRTEAQMEIFNIHNDIENCPVSTESSGCQEQLGGLLLGHNFHYLSSN